MEYPHSAWRRTMKELEVILKAVSKEINWIEAAYILGVSPRTMRRKKTAYQRYGIDGLFDKRRGCPSRRRAPYDVVEKVLLLYRKEYFDFNVKHFHEHLVSEHGIQYSYGWTKNLLQEAGYVKRMKGRGGHRIRRKRRPLFGQMLHLDGSDHEWLALCPGKRQVLLLVVDDATGKNLAGRLVDAETTKNCMRVMRNVVEKFGIAVELYTDRGSVYWHTAKSGKVDRDRLTQFGRAMEELGVEMIPAYSPQARGRGERWNGTWQGRLVAELRREGIDNTEDANRYIEERFIPEMSRLFAVEPAEPSSAFVSAQGADLDRIFAIRYERKVSNDNTIKVNNLVLQLEKSRFREHFVRCEVDVFEHLDETYSVVWNKRIIGRYDNEGNALNPDASEKTSCSMGLSHTGCLAGEKRGEASASPASIAPASALGSLPSVALSSVRTKND